MKDILGRTEDFPYYAHKDPLFAPILSSRYYNIWVKTGLSVLIQTSAQSQDLATQRAIRSYEQSKNG